MARPGLLAFALILAVAGCSSGPTKHADGVDPAHLVDDVFAALDAAPSFHVTGRGADQGNTYSFDVHFGSGAGAGSFTENGQRFELAGRGDTVYVRASAASWKATIGARRPGVDATAARLAAHWVLVPSSRDFAQLTPYVDKSKFVTSFRASAAEDSGPFTRSGTATLGGTDAEVFTDIRDNSKIYVAAHGAPLLLKVDQPSSAGNLTFDQYGQPFTPTLPAADQVIDYTSVVK